MTKIQGFRVKNFRVLKDITLGRLWNTQREESLTPMSAVIGRLKSGVSHYLIEPERLSLRDGPEGRRGNLKNERVAILFVNQTISAYQMISIASCIAPIIFKMAVCYIGATG